MFPECSLRRLLLLTLVLDTHVGKLYSAPTLVLSLSASCSWDGGSQASTLTRTECFLNVSYWQQKEDDKDKEGEEEEEDVAERDALAADISATRARAYATLQLDRVEDEGLVCGEPFLIHAYYGVM
jgi:hypothetical protein